jgi:hypothetical protein
MPAQGHYQNNRSKTQKHPQVMIYINRTFTQTTPESSEAGDFSDAGMLAEREAVTFRELVSLMQEHPYPSNNFQDIDENTWFSSGYHVTNYATGEEEETSIHFHRDNPRNFAKYWSAAARYAAEKQANRMKQYARP